MVHLFSRGIRRLVPPVALLVLALLVPSISPLYADGPILATYPCLAPGIWNAPPPPGFNALAASPAQLLCYGFPSRPGTADTAALAQWTSVVSRATYASVDPTKVTIGPLPQPSLAPSAVIQPNVANQHDDIYSGYLLTNSSLNTTAAIGQWQAPDYVHGSNVGDAHELTTWVGISRQGAAKPLFQAGTFAADGCSGSGSNCNPPQPNPGVGVFYEDPGIIGEVKPGAPPISAGDSIFTEVYLTNNNMTGTFFIEDLNSGQYHSYSLTDTNFGPAGASAIWVSEDPNARDLGNYNTQYNTVRWQEAEYWNGANWVLLTSVYPSAEYHVMTGFPNSGNHMAPTYPPTGQGAFNNCPPQYLGTIPPTCP